MSYQLSQRPSSGPSPPGPPPEGAIITPPTNNAVPILQSGDIAFQHGTSFRQVIQEFADALQAAAFSLGQGFGESSEPTVDGLLSAGEKVINQAAHFMKSQDIEKLATARQLATAKNACLRKDSQLGRLLSTLTTRQKAKSLGCRTCRIEFRSPDELDSHDELVHGDGSSYAQPIDITTLPVQHEQQTNDASARDPRTQALSADYFAQPGRDASVPRPPPRPPAPWSPPQGLLHRHAQFVGDGNRRPSDPHPFGVRQQAFQEQLPPPKRRRSEQHPPPKRRRSKQQPPPKRRRSEQHIPEPRPRQIPPANAEMSLQPAAVSVSSSPIHMAQPPPPLSTQAQESAQHPTPVEAFFPSVHPAIMPGQSTLNPVSAQPAVLVDSLGSPPMLPGYVPEIAPMHDTIPSEHTAFATPPRMHTHEATAGPSGDPWQYAKPEGQSFMETMPVHPPPAFHVRDTSYVNEEIHWQDAAPPTQHQGMPAFYYVNWSGAVPGRVPTMQPCDDVYSSHHVPWHGSIPTASTEIASAAQPSASHNTAGVTQAHPWQDRASGIEGPPMGDVGLCPAPPGPAIHDPHDIRLQGELQAVHAISPTAMRAQSQPLQDRIPGPEQEEPQPVFSFHRVNPDTGLPMRIAAPHKKKVYTFQPLMAGPGQYILEDTSVSGNRRASLDERAVSGPAVRRKRSHHV